MFEYSDASKIDVHESFQASQLSCGAFLYLNLLSDWLTL